MSYRCSPVCSGHAGPFLGEQAARSAITLKRRRDHGVACNAADNFVRRECSRSIKPRIPNEPCTAAHAAIQMNFQILCELDRNLSTNIFGCV